MSYSSKQVVSMIYTLEKDFLGFVRRFFSGRVTNFIVYLGTSFKTLVSKKAETWWFHQTSGLQYEKYKK